MEDVPENVKGDIKFVFAENLDEVLRIALVKWPFVKKEAPKKFPKQPSYIAVA